MKIKLATILWVVTTICLLAGWMLERQHYQSKCHRQLDDEVRVECAIIGAQRRNTFAASCLELRAGKRTPQQFNEFEKRQLVESLIELFLNEPRARKGVMRLENGTFRAGQSNRILDSAGVSMRLLDFKSVEDLNVYFTANENFFDCFGGELFGSDRRLNAAFTDFIERAKKRHLLNTAGGR